MHVLFIVFFYFFFFNDPATSEIYTLSLHDALPIYGFLAGLWGVIVWSLLGGAIRPIRSEEHTSELQSRPHLVCRLLLEKKKKNQWSRKFLAKFARFIPEHTSGTARNSKL